MQTINVNTFTKIRDFFNPNSPVFASRISLIICILLALGGITIGMLENSLAVQTNGVIAAIDILNSFLFLNAVNQSVKSPDFIFNYGYGKYESISILAAAIMLSVVLLYTIIEAVSNWGSVGEQTGNYYILLGFSSLSFIGMFNMYKLQKRLAKRFNMSILDFDAENWKVDSIIEVGVLFNLILGAVLNSLGYYKTSVVIDSTTALLLLVFAMKVPLKGSRDALNQLLDRTLPESIQFDIIAVVAENLNNMCEYKQVHTRRSGKDIFIEIDIVMPYDYTLNEIMDLENQMKYLIKDKYPTAIPRIYVTPCDGDCVHGGVSNCPIKLNKPKV